MNDTNTLKNSTSPYLLQHANNPVNWQEWSEELLAEAKKEDKLILVSIGYAACHWCHVMEHESFEESAVAREMNKHFVCIKVDREERPDVDHYYMSAVQLMGQQGGWPLNVIALPDGRPIWGGTYFPKENWVKNLNAVAAFYKDKRQKAEEYADQLQQGIKQVSLMPRLEEVIPTNKKLLERGIESWKRHFDAQEGGRNGAPKFPMPVNLNFLLYYGYISSDQTVLDFVETSLLKMARGGIYDQLGGGFARYSVDDKWKVPHFEKMLYDNGQLLSIYAKAYQHFKHEEFKTVVYETVTFLERELMDDSGAFYSSLDADSEGEEGKYYVWKKTELHVILGEEYALFEEYYHVNGKGFWEQGNNILLREGSNEAFAAKHSLTLNQLSVILGKWKYALLKERNLRVRPGLDNKTLCSWNALAITGLVDAWKAFKEMDFLRLAKRNATFLEQNLMDTNNNLYHSWKAGESKIEAFLEDYVLLTQAFLDLFEHSGEDKWFKLSEKLLEISFKKFFDEQTGLFLFSSKESHSSISNYFQKEDNVIPAANSVMANNLHRFYLLQGQPEYQNVAKKMLQYITPNFAQYPMAYANWGTLMLKLTHNFYEVAVCGLNAKLLLSDMQKGFTPNVLWAFSEEASDLPFLKDRTVSNKDLVYVCSGGQCKMPVETANEALSIISQK